MKMDIVLNALKHYRLSSSQEKKLEDLDRLERECLSSINARQYVQTVTIQSHNPLINHNELSNYNLNPDYNLDFSLSPKKYVHTNCCLCF